MKRLNGWQRLWIVISVLLVIPSALVVRRSLKSQKDIYGHWLANLSIEVVLKDPYYKRNKITIAHNLTNSNLETLEGLQEAVLILNDRHSQKKAAKTEYEYIDLSEINVRYLEELRSLSEVRKKQFIIRTPIAWILSACSLYLIGLVIAWIRKGFKSV